MCVCAHNMYDVVSKHMFCCLLHSGSGSKSATGLLEWLEVDSALDAFVMTNHQTAFSQSKMDWWALFGVVNLCSVLVPTNVFLLNHIYELE